MEYAQNTCGFGLMAVSLGYFDTLLSMSGSTTSSELNESEKESAGRHRTVTALCKRFESCCTTVTRINRPCCHAADVKLPFQCAKRS